MDTLHDDGDRYNADFTGGSQVVGVSTGYHEKPELIYDATDSQLEDYYESGAELLALDSYVNSVRGNLRKMFPTGAHIAIEEHRRWSDYANQSATRKSSWYAVVQIGPAGNAVVMSGSGETPEAAGADLVKKYTAATNTDRDTAIATATEGVRAA